MPINRKRRDVIRKTWLNPKYWTQIGFDIHVLFLIGDPHFNGLLAKEFEETGDILQLDFQEGHYMLPFKDQAYFEYIETNCPEADYVFKADDDILMIPGTVP